ncbi:MAG: hypothetical protein MRY79_09205 [Alphaproteobacteria bacterium]|nr:hypothetical protein [Alphaproteobacteria bacterium]
MTIYKEHTELSVFDVKELYDHAYAQKEHSEFHFKQLLQEAIQMDLLYRRQLAKKSGNYSPYLRPAATPQTKKQNEAA